MSFFFLIFSKYRGFMAYATLLFVALGMVGCCAYDELSVTDMRVDYSVAPNNIDGESARFSWTFASEDGITFNQRKVKVCVATSEEALQAEEYVLCSDKMEAPLQRVELATESLEPYTLYCWQVVLYNGWGSEVKRSDVAWFSTANLERSAWQAKWITDDKDKDYQPSPMLRKRFEVKQGVKHALLHISAAGYYDAKINGQRVSDDWMNPGFEHVIIRPHFPQGLEWAEASHRAARGDIRSSWRREEGKIILEVVIPINTTATIYADGAHEVQGTGKPMQFVIKTE